MRVLSHPNVAAQRAMTDGTIERSPRACVCDDAFVRSSTISSAAVRVPQRCTVLLKQREASSCLLQAEARQCVERRTTTRASGARCHRMQPTSIDGGERMGTDTAPPIQYAIHMAKHSRMVAFRPDGGHRARRHFRGKAGVRHELVATAHTSRLVTRPYP